MSISGFKYFLVIIDDHSHYVWTFPLKYKSETTNTLKHFYNFIHTQFSTKIKTIQSDHGREFDNHALHNFLTLHGSQIRFSCPHTSQQNGKAERMIRTLTDRIRTLIFHAHLPARFWAEALHTATYLLNITPTATLQMRTPHTALLKTEPDYQSLRVFGCLCYPTLTATTNHKLEPRTRQCIFLGYAAHHKGYKCLDLKNHKIIISRHVIFFETEFPFTETNSNSDFDLLKFTAENPEPYPPLCESIIASKRIGNPEAVSPQSINSHDLLPTHQDAEINAAGPSSSTTHLTPLSNQINPIDSAPTNTRSPPPINSNTFGNSPSPNSAHTNSLSPIQINSQINNSPNQINPTCPNSNEPIVPPVAPTHATSLLPPNLNQNQHSMTTRGKSGIVKPKSIFNLSTHTSPEFAMSDLVPLHYFLGISVTRTKAGLLLHQTKYVEDLLERAGMHACNSCATPVDTNPKLSSSSGEPVPDPTEYISLAGALQYLTLTRPDLSYAVQQVCLYMHDPRQTHLTAARRILRYVKGTKHLGLLITPGSLDTLTAYSDADWAGCPDTRRSTSGYCVFLGPNLISWSAKRQATVSRSSAEAEYRAVANAVAETCWIRTLLTELRSPLTRSTVVYCDNISAVYMSSNPVQHQRTKHVEIDIHFVRDKVALGQVRVLHVPSAHQFADIFTKGLPSALFNSFRTSLCLRDSTATTAGGC
ncbi:hypothetical protein V2J09_017227 [Rumex salicifolius]